MKLSGAHIVIVVAVAVTGLLIYGGSRISGDNSPSGAGDPEQFLEEIRQIAPVARSTEAGIVPPADRPDDVPRLELEPSGDIDIGLIRNDGTTTYEMKVHNKGKVPLKINRISSACGCTRAEMDEKDKTIAPGKSSTLRIVADPARITTGFESTKPVTLHTNDPAAAAVSFNVTVKIDPEYELTPANLILGPVEKGKPHETTMLLRQLTDEKIEITDIRSMARGDTLDISYELRPKDQWVEPDKLEYDIRVRLAEHVPTGPYSGRFTILTTCKRRGQIMVSVAGGVTSWYSMAPARMLVLRQTPGPGHENETTAVITADRPFEIANLKPTIEGLNAVVEPGENEHSKVINLSLEKNAKPRGRVEYLEFTIESEGDSLKEMLEIRIIPSANPGQEGARPQFDPSRALPARPKAAAPNAEE